VTGVRYCFGRSAENPGADLGETGQHSYRRYGSTSWCDRVDQDFVFALTSRLGCRHSGRVGACGDRRRYDAQRNELYFLVCGWHPDFGYVDQPPLVPLISAATQIFGVDIWLLRLPATIVAVGLVFLCAAFARLLGGESRAAVFAAVAAGIAPGLAGLGSHLTTSTFEPIAWTAAAYLLTRAILHDRRADLIWIGLLAGLAMEAKWGIAVWLVALGIGVVASPARRMLFWWQLWLGIVIAAVLFAPNLIWQWQQLAVLRGDPAAPR
jgi:4-amino-4-deoxy-L-arabinose transferase-like glycosyltransferase